MQFVAMVLFAFVNFLPEDIQVGDRIEVQLTNEYYICGEILSLSDTDITLDLSLEYPLFEGTATIGRENIKAIKKLEALDPETRKEILKKKEELKENLSKENKELTEHLDEIRKKEEEEKAAKEKTKEEEKQKELRKSALEEVKELEKALEIFEEFPPGDKWNEKEYERLKSQFVTIKVPLSEKEQRFVDNFQLWQKAKEYQEKKLKEESETPVKEEKE